MRWKALIPTVIVVALVALFFTFIFDGLLKRGIERVGAAANGAKVELDGLHTSFIHMDMTLTRLQVTDPANPMTNSVEIGALRFGLAPKPLSWKKFVVERAEITGIRTGTPRKTSGALPQSRREAQAKEEPSKIAQMGREAAGRLKEQYDPKDLIKLDNLASYKKIKEEKERIPRLAETWNQRLDSIKVEDDVKEARAFAESVKTAKFSGVQDIPKAKALLDQGKQIKENFERTQKNFNDLKTNLKTEIADAKNSLNEIRDLQKQDVENAVSKVKGLLSVDGLTRGLIGPVWYGKIRTALHWFEKIRALVPQKKAETPPPPPRMTGRFIHFPLRPENRWPTFLLMKAGLSGQTSGASPLAYTGTLRDVSSDPKGLGRPITLEISGQKDNSPEALALTGQFNYTGDVPQEKVRMTYKGIALAGTELGDLGGPVAIGQGQGRIEADLTATGETIAGTIGFTANPVTLTHTLSADSAGNKGYQIMHDVLSGLHNLQIAVQVSDTITSPNFQINTNLDSEIKAAVKASASKEADALKAQLNARIEELVGKDKGELSALVDTKTGGATAKLNQKDQVVQAARAELQKALDDLAAKAKQSVPVPLPGANSSDGKPSLPNLKGLFKKK